MAGDSAAMIERVRSRDLLVQFESGADKPIAADQLPESLSGVRFRQYGAAPFVWPCRIGKASARET
jgi:hypothetical protein